MAALRRDANLLVANLHGLPRTGARFELLDYTLDPPAAHTLEIDPALGPGAQAEAWFKRARKLARGAVLAAERAQATRAQLDALELELERIEGARSDAELEQIAGAAEPAVSRALQRPDRSRAGRRVPQRRLPYRRFSGSGGRAILVGRGAADNDRLTRDHARPQDLWLHARDEAGAHVVVPLERGEACPPELLCDAATLAAHFSQARGHSPVDVVHTQRRYVRKPRKSEPGRVVLEREKVLRLRLEPARLKRLLASEPPESGGPQPRSD